MPERDNVKNIGKERLISELETARRELWTALDRIDDAQNIYPGVTKRELLAHIAGWDAMAFDYLRHHVTRQPLLEHGYAGIDDANDRFVARRAGLTLLDVRLECEISRYAMLDLLEKIEDFGQPIILPWGSETGTQFVEGAIRHEQEHTADVLAVTV